MKNSILSFVVVLVVLSVFVSEVSAEQKRESVTFVNRSNSQTCYLAIATEATWGVDWNQRDEYVVQGWYSIEPRKSMTLTRVDTVREPRGGGMLFVVFANGKLADYTPPKEYTPDSSWVHPTLRFRGESSGTWYSGARILRSGYYGDNKFNFVSGDGKALVESIQKAGWQKTTFHKIPYGIFNINLNTYVK
jgi:hypothetical protein